MANPKDVIVVTTSSIDNFKVIRVLKPVSAHIVAGTNFFIDFLAGLSDVFGGTAPNYQKQLNKLYDEAINRIRNAAYEIGGNCVLGLKIDFDEISGKGKSMFMINAIGTAVLIENDIRYTEVNLLDNQKLENISLEKISLSKRKNEIIEESKLGDLKLSEDVWNFISTNQVEEVYPILLNKFSHLISQEQLNPSEYEKFHTEFVNYLKNFPDEKKIELLYESLNDPNEAVSIRLSKIIKGLNLFDFTACMKLLKSENFKVQKYAVRIATYDKPFYNKKDIENLQTIINYLNENFKERGNRTVKKQLLSSKEKEVWNCECGKTNDLGLHCSTCGKDIFGFKKDELNPIEAITNLEQKIELIREYL